MENYSLSDIAAVSGRDGMFGGDSWAWIILVILLGGAGGFGFGNGGRVATVEDVNNSANFTRLENQVRMNENTIQQGFTNIGNGLCDLGYKELQNFSTLRYDNAIGQKDLSAQIADCCCKTQTAIHAEGEATRALIQENKIEALQQKINALELSNALCGVVRYPSATSYCAGPNPFFNSCKCNSGIGSF